ncbi:hypothetical protein RIF29_28961 [Crotalaria pallida]|uniref:Uncharacterized protein n=1 Tax=Crotalaria pallida TaxID=3830 RepID=A0AAN9HTF8_CROPI
MEPDQYIISQLLFDHVLFDVRKAPDLWRKWNSGMGLGLHSLQVLIALRVLKSVWLHKGEREMATTELGSKKPLTKEEKIMKKKECLAAIGNAPSLILHLSLGLEL